jgi:hypothetical protein
MRVRPQLCKLSSSFADHPLLPCGAGGACHRAETPLGWGWSRRGKSMKRSGKDEATQAVDRLVYR